jgi:hypothetical protein
MTVLFTDDFDRADTVSGLGADWEITRGNGGRIISNRVGWGPNSGHGSRVVPSTYPHPADQWAEATIIGAGSSWSGIGVRSQANPGLGEQQGYFFWVEGNGPTLALIVWGRSGQYFLDQNGSFGTWAGGERIRIEAIDEYDGETFLGVRVNGYINDDLVLTGLHSNNPWLSGQPGYNNFGGDTGRGIDDFESGDFVDDGVSFIFDIPEPEDTFQGDVVTERDFSFSLQEPSDVFQGSITRGHSATFALIEPQDILDFKVVQVRDLSFALTETVDTFSGELESIHSFSFSLQEDPDLFNGEIHSLKQFTFDLTDPDDTFSGQMIRVHELELEATEISDTFNGINDAITNLSFDLLEPGDTFAGAIIFAEDFSFSLTEPADVFDGLIGKGLEFQFNFTEPQDIFSGELDDIHSFQFSLQEPSDVFNGILQKIWYFSLNSIEPQDVFNGQLEGPKIIEFDLQEPSDVMNAFIYNPGGDDGVIIYITPHLVRSATPGLPGGATI